MQQTHDGVHGVEVVSGIKVSDVKVDPRRGSAVASAEDKADNDDGQDQQD